eukprot:g10995.t1
MEEDHPQIEPRAGAPPPQPGEPKDPGVDFSKAKIGQMGPESRRRVLKMLQECKAFFPKHTKVVNVLTGREVELPLYDENAKPFACEAQRFNPHMSDILVDQIKDMLEAGILSFANSEWCAKMVPGKKSDGRYRICIDYRELIKLLRKNVGGLGDILGLYDRMKGSKYFSPIDLKSVYHQLPIKRSDRHKTAFRDPSGRLLQWNVASLGISTIPAVFSSTLGDDLRSVMGEGVVKWLDDIDFYSKTFGEHLELIRKVVKILIKHGYTGNSFKSEFFLSEIEFLGVMVGRDGIRPAPSKIKAVQELAIPTTVGEVRSFLGLAGYLRGFVEDFSAITAPISDLLRNKRFSSKRARHLKVPFGPDQVNAFVECIKRLTTHPVMLLPDWNLPFTLHTDASTLATGAVLTQEVDGGSRHGPVGYYSKRLSRAQEKASANDREVLGVLYAVEHFEIYLQHRQFTLITDCSALLWLFSSQNLSSKMHRWALKLMAYDMVLKWRRGTENVGPDALSRLRRRAAEEPEAEEDEVLEGELTPSAAGPVLEGVPFRELTPPLEGERRPQLDDVTDLPSELLALAEMPREEIVLDGICLADLGATVLDDMEQENLTVFYALQITPTKLKCGDEEWIAAQEESRGTLEEAEELSWKDYVKLTTTREDFAVPNTMRRRDTARVLEEWTLPPMLREVLSLLQLQSMERGTAEAPGERMQTQGGPRYQEGELVIGLAALQLEEPIAATAGEPPFDRSRFKVIPRETRAAAAARKVREAKEAQSAAEVDPSPPLQEPEQENSHMESSELQDSPSPEEPALSPQPTSTTEEPDSNMPDTEPPAPAAEAASETAVIPVCRGHSDQLEKMERVLRDPVELATEQQRDFVLGPIRKDLEDGKGEKGDYVLDDQNLLFHAPRGKLHVIALPRRLIPAALALAHGTFGHPGIARTTIIIADKYHWPSLKKDVRRYVLSCRCRMKKRPSSMQLYMLPARFLKGWDVLKVDMVDMKVETPTGNRYILVVVDRATKFLFGFPLPTKETIGVSRKLLELLLIFGLPLSIRCDPGTENTSEIMAHLCRWLKVSLDFGPTNHPRGQGTVERMGAVLQQLLSELCQAWPQRWDEYVAIATWAHGMQPDESLPGHVSPYQMLFGRPPRTPLDRLSPSLDNSGSAFGFESTVEETRRKHVEVEEVLRKRRPWVVVNVVRAGLSFTVRLNGRQVRHRTVAASDMKLFHSRPKDLQLSFEDEFSHFVWGPDLGLVEDSVVAAPLYTLIDRKPTQGAGSVSEAWAWEYRGKYQDGGTSSWFTEDEVKDSFSPLQLDVFHALWEDYHGPDIAPRPPGAPTRGEREVATREAALKEFPLNTEVGRELQDNNGNVIITRGKVCDFYDPYWRVKFSDVDWEELTRRELRRGIALVKSHPVP